MLLPEEPNPCAYVSNNPVNLIDPYGLLGVKSTVGAVFGLAGTAVFFASGPPGWALGLLIAGGGMVIWDVYSDLGPQGTVDQLKDVVGDIYGDKNGDGKADDTDGDGIPDVHDPDPFDATCP